MRFESIHVTRYGCLAGLATPDPLPSIVVVLGPNESGKSTFFSFLADLLYGFRPATRDNHPYTPWSGGDAEGHARIRLDDGAAVEIRRRLASSGRGSVSMDGRTEDIRNRPLGALTHVSRGIFRHVYALTLAELASLEGESWNIVQDRLVAALGMKGLKPPREVAAAFELEANRLWRPDNRGRPRVRVLREELNELYEGRHRATEQDRALRTKVARKVAAEEALAVVAQRRSRERARREMLDDRLTRLLPVRRDLIRIDEQRALTGPPYALENLPADPVAHLKELRNRRVAAGIRVEDCVREAAVCAETLDGYAGSPHEAVAEAEERMRRTIDRMGEMAGLQRDVVTAGEEVEEMAGRCDEQGAALFDVPFAEVPLDALNAVPVQTLVERVGDHERAHANVQAANEREPGRSLMQLPGARRPGAGRLVGGLAGVVAGVAVGTWPLLYPDVTLVLGGVPVASRVALSAAVLLAVTGCVLLILRRDAMRRYRQYRRSVEEAERQRAERVARLVAEEEAALKAVADLVADIPVSASRLATPGLELPAGIGQLIGLLDRLGEREQVLKERRKKAADARVEIGQVRAWVSARVGGDAAADADSLRELLDQALRARETAGVARRQLHRIEAGRVEAETERDAAAWEVDAFKAALQAFSEGDADQGARVAADRLEAHRRAEGLRAELEREHADLADIELAIADADAAGERWEDLRERLDEVALAEDRLTGEAEELQATIGRLETEIRHLGEGETVAAVAGRIEVLKERVREAGRDRDRAFVIARLVREADRRFRDANQPELLLRAGRYLRQVTRGRYDRIEMGDTGDESFYLREPSGDRRIRVGETTSQGTKEQVYMALRLAIVNHLDSGREHLPIFLDETLVNWDAWRRDRAFDLLEQLAAERQVFVFTCHPAMAAEMEDRGGAIIPLTPG